MDFLLSLDEELQLHTFALLKKAEENPFNLGHYSKKIEGVTNLFEFRVNGKNQTIRIFYCYRKNKIILLLHGFIKKTQKIPKHELKLAMNRLKEVQNEK